MVRELLDIGMRSRVPWVSRVHPHTTLGSELAGVVAITADMTSIVPHVEEIAANLHLHMGVDAEWKLLAWVATVVAVARARLANVQTRCVAEEPDARDTVCSTTAVTTLSEVHDVAPATVLSSGLQFELHDILRTSVDVMGVPIGLQMVLLAPQIGNRRRGSWHRRRVAGWRASRRVSRRACRCTCRLAGRGTGWGRCGDTGRNARRVAGRSTCQAGINTPAHALPEPERGELVPRAVVLPPTCKPAAPP